jgi:hypothetical protein
MMGPLHLPLNRRPLDRKPRYGLFASGDGGHVTDELFPRQGAAETSGASGARQIIHRKGPERGCHNGVGTFAGKFRASFGQLPVILGDQHRVLALQPLAKGSRHLFLARKILPCWRGRRGGVLIQRASGRR